METKLKKQNATSVAQIENDFLSLGWDMVDDSTLKQKSKINPEGTKRLLRFRNPALRISSKADVIPEICMTYSADNTLGCKIYLGLFTADTETLLITQNDKFDTLTSIIRNTKKNYTPERAEQAVSIFNQQWPSIKLELGMFKATVLNTGEQLEFVRNVVLERYSKELVDRLTGKVNDKLFNKRFFPVELITGVGPDNKPGVQITDKDIKLPEIDLWNLMLLVHDNIMEGNFFFYDTTRVHKARGLNQIRLTIDFNQNFWRLVNKTVNLY